MKNHKLFYILLGNLLMISCQNEDGFTPRSYPFVLSTGVNQVDTTGAILNFEVKDFGKGQIISYGVEFLESYNIENNPASEEYYVHQIEGKPEGNLVSFKITSDLVQGTEYIAYPFVKTASYKVSGEAIPFTAKGSSDPQILKVTKSTLGLNMSFEIIGKNFSSKKEWNQVEVLGIENYFRFKVNYASIDSLVIGVYPNIYWDGSKEDKFDLQVQTHDQTVNLPAHFNIDYPRILSINTLEVVPGDELFVTTNFENDSEFIYLTVNYSDGSNDNYLYVPLEKVNNNRYRCIMPEFPEGNYKIGLYSSYIIDETTGGGFHFYFENTLEVLSK